MPSPRALKHSVGDSDNFSSDDGRSHHKSSRPRDHRPRAYRNDALMKTNDAALESADSGWDTDYSPRDRYYLSESDDPHELYSPPRASAERKSRTTREHSRARRGPERHRTTDRASSTGRSPSPSRPRPHRHGRHRAPSRARVQDERPGDAARRRRRRRKSASHAPCSRPAASRAASSSASAACSSSLPTSPWPRAPGAASRSVRVRPRAASHAKATTTRPSRPHDLARLMDPAALGALVRAFPWDEAVKVALQAGTVAAIKVGTDAIPWPAKATKIGSAALGAAVVDHVLRPQKKGGIKYSAMRHLAEVVVGNLVVGPALRKADSKAHPRSGAGKR